MKGMECVAQIRANYFPPISHKGLLTQASCSVDSQGEEMLQDGERASSTNSSSPSRKDLRLFYC